jgi:hypothetical protein
MGQNWAKVKARRQALAADGLWRGLSKGADREPKRARGGGTGLRVQRPREHTSQSYHRLELPAAGRWPERRKLAKIRAMPEPVVFMIMVIELSSKPLQPHLTAAPAMRSDCHHIEGDFKKF